MLALKPIAEAVLQTRVAILLRVKRRVRKVLGDFPVHRANMAAWRPVLALQNSTDVDLTLVSVFGAIMMLVASGTRKRDDCFVS
jgi:hypothetical protein